VFYAITSEWLLELQPLCSSESSVFQTRSIEAAKVFRLAYLFAWLVFLLLSTSELAGFFTEQT